MCPYSFYKNLNGRDYIYCLKTDGVCPFTRYCTIIGKMIPNDRKYYTMEDCNLKNEKVLENGEYKVRFEKKGFLYVEINDSVKMFKNIFNDIPVSVKLVFVDGEYYILGTEPKKTLKIKPIKEDVKE